MSEKSIPSAWLRDLAELCAGSGRIIHQDIQSVLRENTYGALAQTLRDEAARREAGETRECLAGKCHTSDTLGTCLPGACLFPDAPPAADLVARLRAFHAEIVRSDGGRESEQMRMTREAAAAIEALRAERDAALKERDEAVNWSDIVDRHGLDQFDDLAEKWCEQEGIKRTLNAVTSVFQKWANDDLIARFKEHIENSAKLAFVEGAMCGVKAAKARVAAVPDELMSALATLFHGYCRLEDGEQKFAMVVPPDWTWQGRHPHDCVKAWAVVCDTVYPAAPEVPR